jgi:hypothetical protein
VREGRDRSCDVIASMYQFGQDSHDTLAFSSPEHVCKVKYLPRNQALSMSRICRLGNFEAE